MLNAAIQRLLTHWLVVAGMIVVTVEHGHLVYTWVLDHKAFDSDRGGDLILGHESGLSLFDLLILGRGFWAFV